MNNIDLNFEVLKVVLFSTIVKKKSDMQFLSIITQSIIESTKRKATIQQRMII